MIDLFVSQVSDPFRIVLLLGLFATMWRTRAATGIWLPLVLGAVFVAVLIPLTIVPTASADLPAFIGVGMVANAAWLAVIGAGFAVWQNLSARR